MTDLTDLIARVEALEGADREVDADLFRRFDKPPKVGKTDASGRPMNYLDWRYEGRGVWARSEFNQPAPDVRIVAPTYTASLDAALALVTRALPGTACTVGKNLHHGHWVASVNHLEDGESRSLGWGNSSFPALALILALLRALAAKDPS